MAARGLAKPDPSPLILRGRRITKATLRVIDRCVQRHFDQGRTNISVAVCKALRWKQENGWLKDRACRDVLRKLEEKGLITLPQRITKPTPRNSRPRRLGKNSFIPRNIAYNGGVVLEWAKGNAAERIWNELVEKHHYLGHKICVGRCIKYLAKLNDEIFAAIGFSSPAWNLEPRDRILRDFGYSDDEIRGRVINNSRFLIVPGKEMPNIASRVLSLSTRRVVVDWSAFYGIKPLFVETFVQPSRFLGTCYKAANWSLIGTTKGYRKNGSHHCNGQERKHVYLYALSSTLRKHLLQLHLNANVSPNQTGTDTND